MIETISIQNFLSFKELQEISFIASNKEKGQDPEMAEYWYKEYSDNKKLLKLLFFVGENGAGKSNVLKAVNYLRDIAITNKLDRSDRFPFYPFLLDDVSRNKPSILKMTYYIEDVSYTYKIVIDQSGILEEELKRNAGRSTAKVYYRNNDVETGLVRISFGAACDMSKTHQKDLQNATIASCSVLASFWGQNMESDVLCSNYEYFRDKISLVHHSPDKTLADKLFEYKEDGRMRELVLQLLKDLTTNIVDYEANETVFSLLNDPNLQNDATLRELMLQRYPEGKITHRFLKFIHQTSFGNYKIDYNAESLGTISMIRLMIVLYDIIIAKKSSFIDEVERGLHTKALEFILKTFLMLSRESQVIVTTHDLKLMDIPFMRRDSVRNVIKDPNGISSINTIDQNSLHRNSSLMNRLYNDVLRELPDMFKDGSFFDEYIKILYGQIKDDEEMN